MNLKLFTVYLIAVILCFQPVFAWYSVIFSTIANGYKAIEYIKSHLPGDQNKALEKVSVKDTGNGCTQIIQKLKGKNTYVNYHVDHDPIYDIVYSAGNNGHTYGKLIETLTDKLKAQGKGSYVFSVAGVHERIIGKQYSCPGTPTKWQGKATEYDYHVVLSNNNRCGKHWTNLKTQSQQIKDEVNSYNNKRNPC